MTQTLTQCAYCRHFRAGDDGIARCEAFTGRMGIPEAIIQNQHDHRKPYPGDHGVRFEPVDDDAAALIADMFDGDTAP